MIGCGSCTTFSIIGESRTVYLHMPQYSGEDNKITKDTINFNFWSGNFAIHDNGIQNQPLILHGIEYADCYSDFGVCFDEDLCFPMCFNMPFENKFKFIMAMSNDNEEVTISGLGDCMDAVFVIKNFNFKTLTPTAKSWSMTLEKVR